MRILITNDDGILSPALPRLVKWAIGHGHEVLTVAPLVEQSAKSHGIDFMRELEAVPFDLVPGSCAYSLDSTPADCVRFACLGLQQTFDLVLSGINRGFNLGRDIMYSGTVAAVFEAARFGIPGIALSTDPTTFDAAFAHLDEAFDFIAEHDLMSYSAYYNINFPLDAEGIQITRQGGIYFSDGFFPTTGHKYAVRGATDPSLTVDTDADIYAVHHSRISITPITAERTDLCAFERLKGVRREPKRS